MHRNIMGKRLEFSSHDDPELQVMQIFPKEIIRHGETHIIPWIETPYGAYAIIERPLLIPYKKDYITHPGISVLFSDTPQSLISVLSGDTDKYKDIDCLSFHRRDDYYINGKMSYDKIIQRIDRDDKRLTKNIERHETFIDESHRLYRSESCVIFALRHDEHDDHYHIYQYVNPQGNDGLFIRDDMLDNKTYIQILRAGSIRVTPRPIHESLLGDHMQSVANTAADDFMDQFNPNRNYNNNFRNKLSYGLQNGTQPLAYIVSRIHIPAFLVGLGLAAVLSSGLVLGSTLFFTLKSAGFASIFTRVGLTGLFLSNNALGRGVNGAVKFITKTINKTKTVQRTRLHDYKPDFTTDTNFIFDTLNSCKMPREFYEDIELVPYTEIKKTTNIHRDLPLHGKEQEHEWELIQRCYTDCHRHASFISQLQNQENGEIALKLIDGEGVEHLHVAQGEAFSFENKKKPTHIFKDHDRGIYQEYETREGDIPKLRPVDVIYLRLSDDHLEHKSTTKELRLLPSKEQKRVIKRRKKEKLKRAKKGFNQANQRPSSAKTPRPLESVDHDAPALKL